MQEVQNPTTSPSANSDNRWTRHPLEPLRAAEVQQSVALLRSMADWMSETRIISIALKEPDKSAVYGWPAVPVAGRCAKAVLMNNQLNRASTVTLDLTANTVIGVDVAREGAQPTLSADEQIECEQAVLESEDFRAALEKHYGINNTSLVMVYIWSAGHYDGDDVDTGQRLTRPLCFLRPDPTDNGYARPIEGIRPVVDTRCFSSAFHGRVQNRRYRDRLVTFLTPKLRSKNPASKIPRIKAACHSPARSSAKNAPKSSWVAIGRPYTTKVQTIRKSISALNNSTRVLTTPNVRLRPQRQKALPTAPG